MTSEESPLVARRSRWLLLGTVIALLAVYVPLLAPALVGQRTIVETGLVLNFEPWRTDAQPADQKHVTIAHDTLDFYLPKTSVFVEALRHGDLATWEPYAAGGSPLATVPETAALSPLSLPYWVLPLDVAPAFVRLLEVLASVGFLYLFLRRLRLSPGAALLGGFLYSTSAFVVLWNNWPQAQVAALVPSLFWATERLLQRRSVTAAVPVAVSAASLVLASFPAVLVYALYLLGPYVLVRTLGRGVRVRDLVRDWGLPAGGLLAGVALAAIQVLPFAHYLGTLDLSYRAQSPKAHPPVESLLTVVAPYAFGSESQLDYFGYKNTVETIAFFGVVGLLLVVLSLALRVPTRVPRGVTTYFACAAVVLLVVGWLSDTALEVAQHLPFVGESFIGRIRVVLGLCLAVLAAIGADRLVRLPRVPAPVRRVAVLLVVGLVGFGLAVARDAVHTARLAGQGDVMRDALVLPAVVGALALAALVVASRAGRTGFVALGLLPVLVAVEGFAFISPRWPSEERSQFYPRTSVHDFLSRNLGHERFGATRGVMFPSTATYYRLRAVNGHTFTSPTWHDAIESIDPKQASGPTLTLLGDGATTASSPVLDRLATKYLVASLNHPIFGERLPPAKHTQGVLVSGSSTISSDVAPGPLRGLVVGLTAPIGGADKGSAVITLQDAGGAVVRTVERRGLVKGQPGAFAVPLVEGPELARVARVSVRFVGVTGTVAATADGRAALGLVRPVEDGLRLVEVDDGVVYQRLHALPRVRLATSAVVQADDAARLAQLADPVLARDSVLLEAAAPAAAGSGTVTLVEDAAERLRVSTRTSGRTWLVVADAMQDGWVAEVDGRSVPLVDADYAGVGVELPAGDHEVVLRYTAPRFLAGRVVTGITALVLLALGLYARFGSGRRRYASSRPSASVQALEGRQPGGDRDSP